MLYWTGRSISRIIGATFGRWKVTGSRNVPRNGGVILAPNHVSYIDPPIVGAGTCRQVHFMAKEELFKIPVMGFIIRKVGAFPVRQKTADRAALRKAIDYLEKGEVVCIFPEGTRSLDGKLMKAEAGIGMVALKSRAPVVPVALIETNKLLPSHSKFFRISRVRVVYGEPITFDDLYESGGGREAIDQVGERVMTAIAELQKEAGECKMQNAKCKMQK